ncbi:MAG: diacylglycerol kinase [Candidatus Omnitrophica bacterium]|nr:diacylglycerol kinase [Candidatus Omnitrophota bacterium]
MKKRGITDSLNYAIEGLKYTLKTQRNMRIHFFAGATVLFLGVILQLTTVEFMLLLGAVTMVIVAEMFNTALEIAVDIFTKEFHHMAKMAKDIAAGCVFVVSVYAIIIGYLVFFKKLSILNLSDAMLRIRQSPWHLTFTALVIVLTLVIVTKLVLHRGTPFRGGWPSGHSAFAFSIFTITAFLSDSVIIVSLVFIMAVLLAASRIKRGIHSPWEVIAGSAIGILVTLSIFQFLYRG